MNIIETRNLTKYYHKKIKGIENLNLSVGEGEMYGFIGPNGAGKSTTIRTLLGLIRADAGTAQLFGMEVGRDRMKILAKIGYMPSEVSFYGGMRVKEILKLSAALRRKDCTAEAKKLCERLQLDPEKRVEELSLGNRKKTSIICALQHKPQLYIFDEPTSGLDPLIQKEFFSILRERKEEGATIFLSSHVLSEIQRHCSRAAIIRDGSIIAEGKIEELVSTSARRVTVHGLSGAESMPAKTDGGSLDKEVSEKRNSLPVAERMFAKLEGVRDIRYAHDSVTFLYQGEMRALLAQLLELSITDLTVTEPDLEEIFLHYYETLPRKAKGC